MDEPKTQFHLQGRVQDVMTPEPVTVNQDETIKRLLEMFKTYKFHGLPVVDERGKLVGIIRDKDIISIFARKEPATIIYEKVRDIMHTPPLTIEASETIQKAIIKMFADQTRFLVVTDKQKNIVGVVTNIDLIKGIHWE
jgi:predicted transcriptional regulator